MKNIVIDTSCLNQSNSESAIYKALKRLSESKEIKIHIPYVVKREYETQKEISVKDDYEKSLNAIKSLSRHHQHSDLDDVIENLKKLKENLSNSVDNQLKNFWENLDVIFHHIDEKQSLQAFEAYFKGEPPLTTAKDRKDIPDSFVCSGIESIKNKGGYNNVTVLANDKKIFNTFSDKDGYIAHQKIQDFINTPDIQNILSNLDTIESLRNDIEAIKKELEKNEQGMKDFLSDSVGEVICGKYIEHISIPDDNNQALITSYYDVENIKLDYDDITHYGNNQIGIKFEADLRVIAGFHIFKSDFYANEYNFSVADWNDHYFEGENDFYVKVTGTLSIKCNEEDLDAKSINLSDSQEVEDYIHDYIYDADMKIESVDDLKLIYEF